MIMCNNVQEQAQDLSGQIFARWQELLQSGDFILGDEVLAFEAWMSGRCGGGARRSSQLRHGCVVSGVARARDRTR